MKFLYPWWHLLSLFAILILKKMNILVVFHEPDFGLIGYLTEIQGLARYNLKSNQPSIFDLTLMKVGNKSQTDEN